MKAYLFFLLAVLPGMTMGEESYEADPSARINEVQVIGTHNSYHVAPLADVANIIGNFHKSGKEALDYTHRSLPEQFVRLGIRQIELDVFADSKGGLYANPLGRRIANGAGGNVPDHDPGGVLKQPGMKVLHIQDIDYQTTVLTLKQALAQLAEWSRRNPRHFPVFVLLELKDSTPSPFTVKPERIGVAQLRAMEDEILSVFRRDEILTPDDVRGDYDTLREAIKEGGWPTVAEASGRIMFGMDNENRIRDLYLKGHETLEDRLLFVSVSDRHPAAAFMKVNDPIGSFERIRKLVEAGFLVRTRADTPDNRDLAECRRRRERAFASGAQFISTDCPEPDARLPEYRVTIEGKGITRPNPVVP